MRSIEILLAICVALTPRHLRAVREEQWRADLRDSPGMGISPSSLIFGAVCSSVIARYYESLYRGSMLLSRRTKGENMKLVLGMMGAAVVLVGGAFAGIQAKTEQAGAPLSRADTSHPECYDAAKMNDPNDYCYQTIGPWNSRLLSDDEVRSAVSLEQMISNGMPTDHILRYFPAYQPNSK
ncbi:hypothetical protein [Pseudarthrobacter sp. Y6]|uniref:hypothetical protein n=1 Tax=Pseudarthrobacter sp. Y6 TaxID=3418422 RepID=UPI003CF2591B